MWRAILWDHGCPAGLTNRGRRASVRRLFQVVLESVERVNVDVVVVKEDKKVLMTERGRDGKTTSEVTCRPLTAMDRARSACQG